MKFLVLALFVCAANAASVFSGYGAQNKFGTQNRPSYNKQVGSSSQKSVATSSAQVSAGPAPFVASPVPPAPFVSSITVTKNLDVDTNNEIITDNKEIRPDGYAFNFQTADGTGAESTGTLKTVGDAQVLVVTGSYKYRNEDGKEVLVSYVADENGYQPSSDLLPVGPEIPDIILRSLEYIASQPKYEEPTKKY